MCQVVKDVNTVRLKNGIEASNGRKEEYDGK